MKQFAGAHDIFHELVDDEKVNWLLGLIAFAVIEQNRMDWMKHFEEHQGRQPSDLEIQNWYKQQPESVILRARGEAEGALKAYAQEITEQLGEQFKNDAQQGIILNEIHNTHRFWPQFGLNIIGGFVGSVIFAALLAILAFIVSTGGSPIHFGPHQQSSAEGNPNDKETGSDKQEGRKRCL